MHNCLELVCRHDGFVLGLLNLLLVQVLKYTMSLALVINQFLECVRVNIQVVLPIACHVVFQIVLVFLDTLQHRPIIDTHRLHQCIQIFQIKVPVRASMRLTRAGGVLRQNLLAAKRAVPATTAVRVAADIAVRMAHIVTVLLVERVVGDLVEAAAPKSERLLQVQTDALEEQRVL